MATARAPSRNASKGVLPPPAVGSRTETVAGARSPSMVRSHRSPCRPGTRPNARADGPRRSSRPTARASAAAQMSAEQHRAHAQARSGMGVRMVSLHRHPPRRSGPGRSDGSEQTPCYAVAVEASEASPIASRFPSRQRSPRPCPDRKSRELPLSVANLLGPPRHGARHRRCQLQSTSRKHRPFLGKPLVAQAHVLFCWQ